MHQFDYSFLKNCSLPSSLVFDLSTIAASNEKSAILKENHPSTFSEMEKSAAINSVRGSNAIEGIVTSEERLQDIVRKRIVPESHNEKEIVGYRDALELIRENHNTMTFSERSVLGLHKIMSEGNFGTSAGKYKTEDNVIMETDSAGNRSVRFRPVAASDTQKAMEQLVLAYEDAKNDTSIHPLLLIPCVVLDFLCIHPFADGNGRISRLLSLLLLYKSGYEVGKYVSFEDAINENKWSYYDALKKSSQDWDSNANSYAYFTENFLATLRRCYRLLDERFDDSGKRIAKNRRIKEAINNSLAPISKSELCQMLPDVSPTTIESVLGKMVKEQALTVIGKGRNTKYLPK